MIQINMQMPTNCLECPVCNEYLCCAIPVGGHKWGENNVSEYSSCRPEWCPMKEQEAKTGKWERQYSRPGVYANLFWWCSVCGEPTGYYDAGIFYQYCPHCGAKLEAFKYT